MKDIESWPIYEPVLEPAVTKVANVVEHANSPLVEDNTPVDAPAETENSLKDGTALEQVLDPSIEYQIGSRIFFGDDLYEVCQTNLNGQNQIALVLVENEVENQPIIEHQNEVASQATQNVSQYDRQKSWQKQGSSGSVQSGSFDSAIGGSSVCSSMGSSLGTSCQDYQQEILQNFDDTVYTTRRASVVNESEYLEPVVPPVHESVRPGIQPKISDSQVNNHYLNLSTGEEVTCNAPKVRGYSIIKQKAFEGVSCT